MTQEKIPAETERDDDDCSCHARALDYGETTLPRATCTDALRQHGKRELDKFPILRRSLGSCYLVPNETINDRDHRKSGDTSHLFTIETMHGEEGGTAETRENGRGRSVRHRSHARVQARFDSAPLPPPPPQISYAHRTYKRLETASFGPNDSDPGLCEGETWRGEE